MKSILTFCSLFLLTGSLHAQALPQDLKIEQQIKQELKTMTLDAKIGQMMQFSVDQITFNDPKFAVENLFTMSKEDMKALVQKYGLSEAFDTESIYGADGKVKMPEGGYTLYMLSQTLAKNAGFQLDADKMQMLFGQYQIGSILNMLGGSATTADFWNKNITQMQAANRKALDIPMLYGLDQVHGSTYTADGTLFPQHIGMCATFNPALAQRMGEICAYETRAGGVPWIFCPDLDLGRKPSWSRCYEGMGEDPYLAGVMGKSYLRGLQGEDPNHVDKYHVGTCLKHYMAYGVPDNGIDRTPANVSEQDLREKFFEPFRVVFNAGALSAMTNSSILNGMNGVANKRLLTNWLKQDLDWDGMIITDWGDIENLRVRDHIAATKKEGIELAINAGVDMIMVTTDLEYITLLKELVNEKKVSMERIDDAVTRILRLKHRLGLFDETVYPITDYPLVGSPEFAQAALQTAIESEVLLKNENHLLPLHKGQKLLVCGPNANTMRGLNGGWSYTWQGSGQEPFTEQYNTIYEALQNTFGKENVVLEEGVSYIGDNWQMEDDSRMDEAVRMAVEADVIIVCIGENSYAETTGNILDANLSRKQQRLVEALQKTGKPVVLVLNEGRPRLIHDLVPGAQAVIDIMLPGNYGGDALAKLLVGEANFSGRLPFTYPSYPNSFTTYDYKICETRETMPGIYNYNAETNVEWWFGAGLSYTTFAYSKLRVNRSSFGHEDELTFTVDVTNTGSCTGKEVVMLYSSDLAARDVIPDNRRLRAFQKVELAPGQTTSITLAVKASDLAYVNRDGKWVLEEGGYDITVGTEKLSLTCQEEYTWDSSNRL